MDHRAWRGKDVAFIKQILHNRYCARNGDYAILFTNLEPINLEVFFVSGLGCTKSPVFMAEAYQVITQPMKIAY